MKTEKETVGNAPKEENSANYFRISKKVSLPVNQSKIQDKDFIPKDIGFEDNKIAAEQVAISIEKKIPVLLVGETGTGKTSLVRHLAAKTNNGFVRVNHNGGTTIEDIVGRYLIDEKGTRWVDGILIEAMKKGYWYLGDEINAASAEINFVYHSLLDDDGRVLIAEKGNEVVIPHPNFRFFGGMNPPMEYAGTKELNKALISRFAVVKIDFVPPDIEKKIVMDRTGVPADVAENMVKFAVSLRSNHAKQVTRFVLSTRDLIMWGQMYKFYEKYLPSAQVAVLNKVGDDDIEAIKDLANLSFKALDAGQTTTNSSPNSVDERKKEQEEAKKVFKSLELKEETLKQMLNSMQSLMSAGRGMITGKQMYEVQDLLDKARAKKDYYYKTNSSLIDYRTPDEEIKYQEEKKIRDSSIQYPF